LGLKPIEPEELMDRLHEGENSLDLSIEKWQRLVAAWQEDPEKVWREDLMANTCGLCQEHLEPPEFDQPPCHTCPYVTTYGKKCDDEGMHWQAVNQVMLKYEYGFKGNVEAMKAYAPTVLNEFRWMLHALLYIKERELEKSNRGDSTTMAPEGDDCKPTDKDTAIGERVQG